MGENKLLRRIGVAAVSAAIIGGSYYFTQTTGKELLKANNTEEINTKIVEMWIVS